MSHDAGSDLEAQISAWRGFVEKRQSIGADVDELESHLRDRIDALTASGLSDDEAFLVAVKRLGRVDELSREFAREHSERLWKQLVIGDSANARPRNTGLVTAVVFAVIAAVVVKLPAVFGVTLDTDPAFYVRNAAIVFLPALAAYFLMRRHAGAFTIVAVAAPFVAAAAILNAYPFAAGGMTELLAAVHAVVALWIIVGIGYANGDWRSARARMDLIRFTGEWAVYMVLLALGGGVLAGLTIGVFLAVGVDASPVIIEWVLPCGAAGAVIIAAWLVEVKQSVIENIAPVLTKVFTPLFTLMLLVLIGTAAVQRTVVGVDRDLLIIFDLVLIVTLGLLLYSLSARDPESPASWFEALQLVLLVAALVVDAVVLIAMLSRIGEYGASANKVASLGLNLILIVNLAGAAWLQLRFLRGRVRFAVLERWQTAFVPIYLAWAAIVVVVFPPVFAFA